MPVLYIEEARCLKVKEEICLFYIRSQSEPRSKHSPPLLYETSLLMMCKVTVHTEYLKAVRAPCRIFEC